MAACSAFGCTNRFSKRIPGITFHRFPKTEPRRTQWIIAIRRKDWLPTEYSRLCSAHFSENMFDRSMRNVLLKPDAVPTIFKAFPDYFQKNESKRKTLNGTKSQIQPAVTPKIDLNKSKNQVQPAVTPKIDLNESKNLVQPAVTPEIDLNETKNQIQPPVTPKIDLNESENQIQPAVTPKIGLNESKNQIQPENNDVNIDLPSTSISSAENSYKRALEEANKRNERDKKKIKTLQQTIRRCKKKICSLNSIISILKDERYLSEEACSILEVAADQNEEIFSRLISTSKDEACSKKFSPEIIRLL